MSCGDYGTWLRTLRRTLSNAPQDVMIRPKPAHDTDCITYRCFLPDLTGFVTACCVVPDLGQPLAHGSGGPQKGIRPRIKRISGNRTPLAPRLAQPSDPFIAYARLHFNSKRSDVILKEVSSITLSRGFYGWFGLVFMIWTASLMFGSLTALFYGSLKAFILFMIWVLLASSILLFCAEIAAANERLMKR